MFVDGYDEIQWDALNYLISECNYGGRVTDPQDRVLLNVMLKNFINPDVFRENYHYSESSDYFNPGVGSFNFYIE